jgi:hypothetical protein
MFREGTVAFGALAGRCPGRVARNRLESFAQFTGNAKFSSLLGPTPVDRRPMTGEGCKMRRASSRAEDYAANPFQSHYHRQ